MNTINLNDKYQEDIMSKRYYYQQNNSFSSQNLNEYERARTGIMPSGPSIFDTEKSRANTPLPIGSRIMPWDNRDNVYLDYRNTSSDIIDFSSKQSISSKTNIAMGDEMAPINFVHHPQQHAATPWLTMNEFTHHQSRVSSPSITSGNDFRPPAFTPNLLSTANTMSPESLHTPINNDKLLLQQLQSRQCQILLQQEQILLLREQMMRQQQQQQQHNSSSRDESSTDKSSNT
ncbi:uncharacterized protein BX663DRAFT_1874 [Cokeromyces recurvatus]|uniref:uncharacterized protein n=1 Tax=Cokeromyces recurvatus TaxID=90255 RepID=UPI00221EA984|nr:uncharacterized protein BX663DRAFT_1874 [Cokeromyces recurvatus]KAI7907486.1 hypothetical protein BX663DRAFT_1874 [Cokeromyces recurvatus]